ncbi:MAG: AAA family ATPase [Gammaproteobacteria bacterium]|nr:AAA family ATPase [Gammaproteobacteria bacterium]
MYTTFFGLKEMPFSITPDPAYLYMSPRHQEALGHLLYGTGQHGGFVQLTGEVGTGKTTIIRTLLAQKLDNVDLAMILNPRQNELEFVASLCDELHVRYERPATLKTLVDALNAHLLAAHGAGRRTVLIIDEAQNLQPEVLEQVRLLTNLETHKEKLLRIMLVGQPELADLLARPDLRQLAQRITARYHLTPLSAQETVEYVRHRLGVAGGPADLFTPGALRQLHRHSRGIPRLVNILCDRALLGAYGQGTRQVTAALLHRAAREVAGELSHKPVAAGLLGLGGWVDAALAAGIAIVLGAWLWPRQTPPAAEPPLVAAAAVPEAPPEPAPAPTLEQLLQSTEALPTVLGRLVQLWGANPQPAPGERLCTALAREALECHRATGTWADLKLANRPAVLTVSAARGGRQYVLLRGLSRDRALLETAAGPLELGTDRLELVWTGEYLLLWRRETPSSYIPPDSSGPAVQWLREKLAQAEGRGSAAPVSDRFDADLRQSLMRFQGTHGLDPDGLAGVRTLIVLSDVAPAPGTPALTAAVESPKGGS